MQSLESHETVPCAAQACQSIDMSRAVREGLLAQCGIMNVGAAGILRLTGTLLATLLIGFPAVWAAFAIWYQAPGGQALKTGITVLWAAFSVAILLALWQGRATLSVMVFAVAFGAVLFWWQQIAPSNERA